MTTGPRAMQRAIGDTVVIAVTPRTLTGRRTTRLLQWAETAHLPAIMRPLLITRDQATLKATTRHTTAGPEEATGTERHLLMNHLLGAMLQGPSTLPPDLRRSILMRTRARMLEVAIQHPTRLLQLQSEIRRQGKPSPLFVCIRFLF